LLGLVFLVLALVVGAVHLYLDKQPRTKGRVAEIFLLSFLVITVGIGHVFFFISHTVFADATAASIGWAPGNPFQIEVAVATSPSLLWGSSAIGSGETSRLLR
jgi:hypothetical protein